MKTAVALLIACFVAMLGIAFISGVLVGGTIARRSLFLEHKAEPPIYRLPTADELRRHCAGEVIANASGEGPCPKKDK